METINTISDKFEEALNDYAMEYFDFITSLADYFFEKYGKEVPYSAMEEEIKGLPIVDGSEDFGDWSSLINAMAVRGGLNGIDSILVEVIDRLQNELCAVVVYD